jgi:hypothetical protein
VIDYETFAKIHDCRDRQGLSIAQTARALGLHPKTVATWLKRARFEPRRSRPRGSVLDPFKVRITRLLDTDPCSAQKIFRRPRKEGYSGGVTILRDYVASGLPSGRSIRNQPTTVPSQLARKHRKTRWLVAERRARIRCASSTQCVRRRRLTLSLRPARHLIWRLLTHRPQK